MGLVTKAVQWKVLNLKKFILPKYSFALQYFSYCEKATSKIVWNLPKPNFFFSFSMFATTQPQNNVQSSKILFFKIKFQLLHEHNLTNGFFFGYKTFEILKISKLY